MSSNRRPKARIKKEPASDALTTDEKPSIWLSTAAQILLHTLREESELFAPGAPLDETAFYFKHFYHNHADIDHEYQTYLNACAELSEQQLIKRYTDTQKHYIIDTQSSVKKIKLVAIKDEPSTDILQPTSIQSILSSTRSGTPETTTPSFLAVGDGFIADEPDDLESQNTASEITGKIDIDVDSFFATDTRTIAQPKTPNGSKQRVSRKRKR